MRQTSMQAILFFHLFTYNYLKKQVQIQAFSFFSIMCAGAHRSASLPVSLLPFDFQVEFTLPVPLAAAHWWAALCVPGVWQIVQEHQLSAATQPVAFGPATTCLLCVRQGIFANIQPKATRAYTLGWEAFPMRAVPQEFHTLLQSSASPSYTLLSQRLQVSALWERVRHALLPAAASSDAYQRWWGHMHKRSRENCEEWQWDLWNANYYSEFKYECSRRA